MQSLPIELNLPANLFFFYLQKLLNVPIDLRPSHTHIHTLLLHFRTCSVQKWVTIPVSFPIVCYFTLITVFYFYNIKEASSESVAFLNNNSSCSRYSASAVLLCESSKYLRGQIVQTGCLTILIKTLPKI